MEVEAKRTKCEECGKSLEGRIAYATGAKCCAARLYHVVVVNENTGKLTYMTATPVTHAEGCTILGKIEISHKRKWLRKLLKEVT